MLTLGFIARNVSAPGGDSIQHVRDIPRAVKDADDVQPARWGGDAVENQIIREPPHRPETQSRKFSAIGLVARADFRPLRQRAETQPQSGEKSFGGFGIFHCDKQMDVRHVANGFLAADDFKRLQVA